MKKFFISLLANFMFCALAFSSAVEIETNEISRLEKEIAEKKDWANRNKFSEEESGPNSPLGQALARNAKELKDLESRLGDLKKKPEILTEREKLDPRKHEGEVMGALKEGRITRVQAQKKLGALRAEMEKKGEFKRPKRRVKPELSDTVKDSLAEIKADQQQLHESMKAKLADLGKDASKEDMRDAIEAFKADNKDKFEAIKQAHDAIRESIESARPEKPERPELTTELKVKVEALKEKHEELHTARKELHKQLKEASKEEKQELITEFKETNKAKHEEIKTQSKEIKEEIRALVETEATRTSDL